jgi:uncharacterized protein
VALLLRLVALLLALWWLVTWVRGRRSNSELPRAAETRPEQALMVRCQHCGMHVPQLEALQGDTAGVFYCTPAHRDASDHAGEEP